MKNDQSAASGNKELLKKNAYLEREIERLLRHQARQEKITDINWRLLKSAGSELEDALYEAEQANKAKTDFLANMSHEIRTPLNILLGMADALAETSLDSIQRSQLGLLQKSGKQLLEILNNVLELSRIDSGKITLDKHPFDLEKLLSDVKASIQPVAWEKGLTFRMHHQLDEYSRVGDHVKLRQVLVNLLNNAVKFTDQGEVSFVVTCQKSDKTGVTFQVSDTGRGISEEALESIFSRFSRDQQNAERLESGVGLGLSICKRLVAAMGGTISVESTLNEGTIFTVYVPLEPCQLLVGAEVESVERKDTTLQAEVKILIVEDVRENFLVVEQFLSTKPVELYHASNGLEALSALQAGEFQLVLMDIRMPLLDGVETMNIISSRVRYLHPEVPVVAMTAHAFEEQRGEFLDQGFTDVLSKPFDKKKLIALLEKHLSLLSAERVMALAGNKEGTDIVSVRDNIADDLRPFLPDVLSKLEGFMQQIGEADPVAEKENVSKTLHTATGLAGMYTLHHMVTLLQLLSDRFAKGDRKSVEIFLGEGQRHLDGLYKKYQVEKALPQEKNSQSF